MFLPRNGSTENVPPGRPASARISPNSNADSGVSEAGLLMHRCAHRERGRDLPRHPGQRKRARPDRQHRAARPPPRAGQPHWRLGGRVEQGGVRDRALPVAEFTGELGCRRGGSVEHPDGMGHLEFGPVPGFPALRGDRLGDLLAATNQQIRDLVQ